MVYPSLGIGVLQWNASAHTVSLLEDLQDAPCALAICDNGSLQNHVDTVLNYLQGSGREVSYCQWPGGRDVTIFIRNSCNSGFAAGMNLCVTSLLEQAIDWVWLLNNDTRLEAESIVNMLESIEDLAPGVYGTSMQDITSGAISYGNRFSLMTSRYRPIGTFSDDYEVLGDWYPDGASMLIHREVFEKVGLLSEDYFIYYEELDFKRRITEQGYQLKLLPGVVVQHAKAGSSSQSSFAPLRMYHETFSTLTFYKKHHLYYFPVVLLLRTPVRLLTLLLKGRFAEMKPVIEATRDFLTGKRTEFYGPVVTDQRYFSSRHAK